MLIVTELYNLEGAALAGLHNPQMPLHPHFYQNLEFFKFGKAQIPVKGFVYTRYIPLENPHFSSLWYPWS